MAWTDPPRTWVTAETPTAAIFNAHLKEQLIAAFPETTGPLWKAWTPTLVNMTLGNGTIVARYARVGDMVTARFNWTFGSTSSIDSAANTISLPVTASSSGYAQNDSPLGILIMRDDTATAKFVGGVYWNSSTVVKPHVNKSDATYVTALGISSTIPFTWTTSDTLSFVATYEAA